LNNQEIIDCSCLVPLFPKASTPEILLLPNVSNRLRANGTILKTPFRQNVSSFADILRRKIR